MEEKIEILYANNNDTVFPAFVVVNDADLFYFQTGQEFLEWKTPSELAASHETNNPTTWHAGQGRDGMENTNDTSSLLEK